MKEYKVIVPMDPKGFEKKLNELAEEGWKLHSFSMRGSKWINFSAVMERE